MSSIPLPALDLKPPQQPDIGADIGRLVQMKGILNQQALQGQQLVGAEQENQQRQMDLDSQRALQRAYTEANGDPDKTTQLAAKYGAKPQALIQWQNTVLDQKTKTIDLVQKDAGEAKRQADLMQGAHDAVTAATDKPTEYLKQLSGLQQQGVNVSQMPPEYPGDQQFQFLGAVVKGHTQMVDETVKQQEAAKNAADAGKAAADTAKDKAEIEFYKQHPGAGAPGVPAETVSLMDYMRAPQKAGEPMHTPANYTAWKAQQTSLAEAPVKEEVARIEGAARLQQQQSLLTDQGKQMAAENYYQTGQMPSGVRSPAITSDIINRAAQLHPGGNLSGNKAAYEANKKSYDNVTGTLDTLSAFESAGLKNLKQFTDLADKLPDTGIPWANTPVRALDKSVVGDQWMPAVEAARTVGLREIARVTNDPKLSGVLSDSAREQVQSLSPENATLPQIKNVVKVLTNDMANVHQSLAAQKADIGNRMGIAAASPQGGAAQSQSAPPASDFFSRFGGKADAKQ